jgi:peroxiredoxin (alkyl hydroperoxide reductase subunit C)
MLSIGDRFPEYSLTALVSGDLSAVRASAPEDYFTTIDSTTYAGKWRIVFFWPKDFTFVCPTEIAEFGRLNTEFADRDAQVLGASVDNEYVHYAWRNQHEDLKSLPFPMLSDLNRTLAGELGVLNRDGVADRATFIVDPDGIIQFAMVTAGSVGRNVQEVLRVLDALQTDELCACNWRKGAATLDARSLMAQELAGTKVA